MLTFDILQSQTKVLPRTTARAISDRTWFLFAVVGLSLLQNVYPIYQAISTGGYLFYRTASDEASYLQYDFSKATQSLTRVSQFLVTALHEVGLSGGLINFVFDLVAFPVFLIAVRACFKCVGQSDRDASVSAVILALLPLILGGVNPLIHRLFLWNLESGWIYWLSVPESRFLPLARSPEPQFSLAILSCVVWWSIRKKSFLYLYLCLPFLYVFVAVPAVFVVMSLHLRQRMSAYRRSVVVAPLASIGVLGVALWIHFNSLTPLEAKQFFVQSRLPILSFTFLLAATFAAVGQRNCPPQFRYLMWILALAPLVSVNHQVFTGVVAVPTAYEQHSGVLCASLVVVFVARSIRMRRAILYSVVCVGICFSGVVFHRNLTCNAKLVLDDELLQELRVNADRVAINSIDLAQVANMVLPKQRPTLLAYARSFASLSNEQTVREYRCARQQLLGDPETEPVFRDAFKTLDAAYRYQSADFKLIHIGRKSEFQSRYASIDQSLDCEPMDIHVVIVGAQE